MDHATTVEEVVRRFYSGGGNDSHYLLLQYQASREAWSFVWPLLESSKPWEVQFFAASTLQAKISKQWEEVPETEYSVLKDHLLRVLTATTMPKIILTKLCDAFAILLLNSYNVEDEQNNTRLLDDLVEILPYSSSTTLPNLLRVFGSLSIAVSKCSGPKRIKLREELGMADNDEQNWSKATWLLQQVLTTVEQQAGADNDEYLYLLALDCLLSWLKLGPSLDSINQIFSNVIIAATRFVPISLEEGADSAEYRAWELAQDCLMHTISREALARRPQMFWEWARAIVTTAHVKATSSFMLLLCNLADTHSRTILLALTEETHPDRRWTVETLIELILRCSEDPRRYPVEERLSILPFGFWYTLQDDLSTLDSPLEQQARMVLRPIYARLTEALLRKSTLPLTQAEAGDADERELFRCYRQDASDTLVYCFNVLGSDLLMLLGQRLSHPLIDTQKWNDVEASLMAFEALPDCIESGETEYVAELMNLVLTSIPYVRYPREVLASVCSLIGSYAEWLGDNPTYLEKALRLITFGLTSGPATVTQASMALKDISRECQAHLPPLAPSILETISRSVAALPPGTGEGLRLMYAAGKLLNSLPSTDEQLRHLDATLGICVRRLQELLQLPPNGTVQLSHALANNFRMATMFLSTLEGAMGNPVLEGLLPIFKQIIEHNEYRQDEIILESLFACAQRSLQCLHHPETDCLPLLPLLITAYKNRPVPAALQFLRQLITLLGGDKENHIIAPIFAEISAHSLGGFNACRQGGGDLSDFGELLEAYFGLLGHVCRKSPKMMLQVPDHILDMLRCGIMGLGLPESGIIKAAATFIINAINQVERLESFITPVGPEIVSMLIDCVLGRITRNNLEPHAKVMLALNKNCKKHIGQWVRTTMDERELPVSPGDKETFTRKILSERNQAILYESMQKFNLQCQKSVVGL